MKIKFITENKAVKSKKDKTVWKTLNKYNEKEDLEENVELHDHLNPKIWDEENHLRQEVKSKIIEIAEAFKNQLAEDNVHLKIADIYLLGSNANYNYNEQSDLDIHLIVDEKDDCIQKHLPIIYQAYKSLFNNKYAITIRGINVELYVENKDKLSNVSTGVYSLSNGWIKKPARYDIPEIDDIELDKRVQFWENKYYDITGNPSIDKIENFINAIYDIRQESISTEGEFGIDNLVFKEIRRLGYLDDLKELKTQLRSKELSLESLQK